MTPETKMDATMESVQVKYTGAKRRLTEDEIEADGYYLAVKRIFDIIFSLVGLVALSWLFLIVAALVFLDDPHGSPLYCQPRVGKNGKVFRLWKFRSMVKGADRMVDDLQEHNEKDGPVFKIKDDPRITRVGRFIRKTSIDELPQLWNVLVGDMSIVGPRPPLIREVEEYDEYQHQRLLITPGLTCYWQVCKDRDDISFDEWVAMDLQYILDRSFWVDLKLIIRTVAVVFTGQGN